MPTIHLPRSTVSLVLALIFFMSETCNTARAQEGIYNVYDLARLAQVIVVGTLKDTTSDAGPSITISIDRSLKGDISAGHSVVLAWKSLEQQGCDGLPPIKPLHGIWFLNKTEGGSYMLDPFFFSQSCSLAENKYETPAGALPPNFGYTDSNSTEDKLGFELAWSLWSSEGKGPSAFSRNSSLLSGMSKNAQLCISRQLLQSDTTALRFAGLAGMIRVGDPGEIIFLANNLEAITTTPLPNTTDCTGVTYEQQLSQAVASVTNNSDATVTSLDLLLDRQDAPLSIRRASTHALRNIHTALAVQLLSTHIGDSDATIRTNVISAISCYANALPVLRDDVPGHGVNLNLRGPLKDKDTLSHLVLGPMGSDEARNLAFWTDWWARNGSKIQVIGSSTN